MKELFEDITQGLKKRGWNILGGNDGTFLILQKLGKTIKAYANNYENPNHFIIRYSYNEKKGSK